MQIKTLEIKKELALDLLKFSALMAVGLLAPLMGQQSVTGSMVNATLFIATAILGYRSAIAIGLIPSLVALMSGTLPAPLAPMVPFIICSNTILILVFEMIRRKNYWLGVAAGSLCKFCFLFATSSLMISFLYKGQIAQNLSAMMGYPQLITALAGGLIAYIFLKNIKKS